MKVTDKIEITNEDNMELMKRYPDNYFDLAIVDPPYGIDAHKDFSGLTGKRSNGTTWVRKRPQHKTKDWDKETPKDEYWKELIRVSKNQIIWGGNYFDLPPTRGIICWDKKQRMETFSAWEMAWTSFDCVSRLFEYDNKGFMCKDGLKIHPTQKPVKLYEWLLMNYAKEGNKILDTHLGSGSIAIACHNLGFELTACELDKEYFDKAIQRIKNHTSQQSLF